jgi:phosphoribosyl 1,2-cyclic phosphate phosphodiesterase
VRARILGSGTSSGVPRIGNDWGACDPAEPRNRRTRASLLIEHEGVRVLVDTSPDMREQLLAADVDRLDAVVWTHDHADHCHGIDDLRQVFHALGEPVSGYARPDTLATLRRRFGYVFEGKVGYPAVAMVEPLPDLVSFGAMRMSVVDQPHGRTWSAGLRFEVDGIAIGYATDISEMTDALRAHYADLDVWIVDALREAPHPSHANLPTVLGWIEELRPSRTVLIHMDHSMDYATLRARLPSGVEPGYDGMELSA